MNADAEILVQRYRDDLLRDPDYAHDAALFDLKMVMFEAQLGLALSKEREIGRRQRPSPALPREPQT